MRLGITLSHVDHLAQGMTEMVDLAVEAEEHGIDHVVLTDHVVLGTRLDAHDALGGAFPFPPTESYPDPLIMLAAMAACTHRIRLSTGVLIAPLRPAVVLAKMVATLDALSEGRVDLGLGTGWQVEEFEAVGVPLEGKAKRMDDTVGACRALWSEQPASFESATVRFDSIYCTPRPANGSSVPIWFGGTANRATVRRIATLGDGWLPLGYPTADEVGPGIADIRAAFAAHGRNPEALGVRVMLAPASTPEETLAALPELDAVGVTAVSVPLGGLAPNRAAVGPLLTHLRTLVDAWNAEASDHAAQGR